MNYFDLFFLGATILLIVVSVRYRKVKVVWTTYTLLFFLLTLPIAIFIAPLVTNALKSRQEKRQAAIRRMRIVRRIDIAMMLPFSSLVKLGRSMQLFGKAIQNIAKEDEKRSRQRSILNPFAYISVWNPVLGLWRAKKDIVRIVKANPNAALRGLRAGMFLSSFLTRL